MKKKDVIKFIVAWVLIASTIVSAPAQKRKHPVIPGIMSIAFDGSFKKVNARKVHAPIGRKAISAIRNEAGQTVSFHKSKTDFAEDIPLWTHLYGLVDSEPSFRFLASGYFCIKRRNIYFLKFVRSVKNESQVCTLFATSINNRFFYVFDSRPEAISYKTSQEDVFSYIDISD